MAATVATLMAAGSAQAACTPSATHYCIRSQGFEFQLSSDPGGSYASRPTLQLVAGETYTFEVDDSSMVAHALQISLDTITGSPGVTNSISSEGQTLTYTAPGVGSTLYYVCAFHGSLEGGTITVVPGCPAGFHSNNGTCVACTGIAGCTALTCTTTTDSQCAACDAGYFLSSGACSPCTAIPGCTGEVTCTTASDSSCSVSAVSDDLHCYAAKDLKTPAFTKQEGIPVSDEFGTTDVDVLKPSLLCTPASIDGSTVSGPQDRLCCYTTNAPKLDAPARVEITDGFGTRQLQVGKSSFVCRPCTATVLP